MADRTRCLAIALITLNSLDFLLCAGSLAYQIIGERAGSLIDSKNSVYNLAVSEISTCSPWGYPEKKFIYLYLQLSVANAGMLIATLANIVGLFFSVGLFGTTKQPKWKYCSIPKMRIKGTLYCMYALATLFAATFAGFLLAPYFYISSFTCNSPNALTYQAALIIEVALGGASFLFALVCMILTFFIQVEKREDPYVSDPKQLEMVPLGNADQQANPNQQTDGNGMMTNENYPDEGLLEFQLTKNPLTNNDGDRDNQTMINYNGEAAELEQTMLNKNVPEQEPEPGPLQIIPDPFMQNYQGGDLAGSGGANNRSRRYRLQTGFVKRNTPLQMNENPQPVPKVNPFMGFTPQKTAQGLNKQQPNSATRQQSAAANKQTPNGQGQSAGNSNQQQAPFARKLKSHPKLESSMKNAKYKEENQYAAPEVPSFSEVPQPMVQLIVPTPMQPNQRQEPADVTMTLMNELNKMNFVQGNPASNTYGVIQQDVSELQMNHDQSMDIGVSQVLPEGQLTSRRLGMTPL